MNARDWKYQATHFDQRGPFTPHPRLLRETGFRYQYILKEVVIGQALGSLAIQPASKILDVGCGRGILLDRLGAHVQIVGIGVDVSKASLKKAREESLSAVEVVRADARRLPFADDSFHVSLSLDTLEHVGEPEKLIEELVRVTRQGGKLVCYAVSAKNRWTFNWFLMAVYDMLGLDHWSWAGHDPDLLVDPEKTYARLVHVGCKIDRFEPFHAFFTIMLDQGILALLWAASKLGVFNVEGDTDCSVGRWILTLTSGLSRAMLRPLRALDAPWTRRGFSNGFLVVGTKCQVQEEIATAEDIYSTPRRSQAIAPSIAAQTGRGGPRSTVEARETSERT